MFWFLIGIVIVLLGGYIIIGVLQLLFGIIGNMISWIFHLFFDRND